MRQLDIKILNLAESVGFIDANDAKNINYLENGILDSFQFVSFITLLEDEFKISFSQNDFDDPRFAKISTLEELIREKLNN